jgi:L-ascorbate metabolism protein UlaG (beta-lactamase superfamily)
VVTVTLELDRLPALDWRVPNLIEEGTMKKISMIFLLALSMLAGVGASRSNPILENIATMPAPVPGFPSLSAAPSGGVRVTFVGNAGFLITINGKKILIDAMFSGFPDGYQLPQDVQEALVNARPPFDGVDLILVTHNHGDHFDAPMVRRHLKNNPKARLVSTAQVAGQLADFGNRVIALAATKGKPAQTDVDGIQVQAVYLSHGSVPAGQEETVNFGYIATVDAIRLFHTGDVDVTGVDMTEPLSSGKRIDLAFVAHFHFNEDSLSRKFIREWINGRYFFPIHYVYTNPALDRGKIKSLYPDAILFEKELQSWDMPISKSQ